MAAIAFSRISALPSTLSANTVYVLSVDDTSCRMIVTGLDSSKPRDLTIDMTLGSTPVIDDNTLTDSDPLNKAIYKLQNQILANKLTGNDILAIPVAGLNSDDESQIVDGDSLVIALGKLQSQIDVLVNARNTSYFRSACPSESTVFVQDPEDLLKLFHLDFSTVMENPSNLVTIDQGDVVIPSEWQGLPLKMTLSIMSSGVQTQDFMALMMLKTSTTGGGGLDLGTYSLTALTGESLVSVVTSQVFTATGGDKIQVTYQMKKPGSGNVMPGEIQLRLEVVQAGPAGKQGPTGLPLTATFTKPVTTIGPSIKKASATTVAIAAGTSVFSSSGTPITFSSDTVATNSTALVIGKNYRVYVTPAGAPITAVSDGSPLPGSIPSDSVVLGGFHYGAIATGTTVSSGSFASTGSGMIWTQADVNTLIGINEWSIWDQYYRPKCRPEGMACVKGADGRGLFWFDIYLTSTSPYTTFSGRYGSDICSGSVPPLRPTAFGGNGIAKYTGLNWFNANEVAIACGKRLPSMQEFSAAAFGVTEGISIGGENVTPSLTARAPGYTSKWGGEQMTGHIWVWGDSAMGSGSPTWTTGTGRGDWYGTPYVPTFGGNRSTAARTGSQCAHFGSLPSGSSWAFGLRLFADHFDGSSR